MRGRLNVISCLHRQVWGVRRNRGRRDFAPAPQLELVFALTEPLLGFLAAFFGFPMPGIARLIRKDER